MRSDDAFDHKVPLSPQAVDTLRAERELGQDRRLLADRLIIDLMLAHSPKGLTATELRYNRAAYMPRRRELAHRWADLIMEDALPAAEILNSPRRKPPR